PSKAGDLQRLGVDRHAVVPLCPLDADEAVADVGSDSLGVAFEWIAEAAAAAGSELDDGSCVERVGVHFEHVPFVVAARVDDHVRADRFAAAEQAPGRTDGAVEPQVEAGGGAHFESSVEAAAAAEAA